MSPSSGVTNRGFRANISTACALRAQDEDALTSEARWFVKEYQFVTDTYRLFSMLSHLAGNPRKSLFNSAPSMKFMLRQIKAMDFTLPDADDKPKPPRQSVGENVPPFQPKMRMAKTSQLMT